MERKPKEPYQDKPNVWAIRLIGLLANSLSISSADLNQAYRDCIKVIRTEQANQRREAIKLVHTK